MFSLAHGIDFLSMSFQLAVLYTAHCTNQWHSIINVQHVSNGFFLKQQHILHSMRNIWLAPVHVSIKTLATQVSIYLPEQTHNHSLLKRTTWFWPTLRVPLWPMVRVTCECLSKNYSVFNKTLECWTPNTQSI